MNIKEFVAEYFVTKNPIAKYFLPEKAIQKHTYYSTVLRHKTKRLHTIRSELAASSPGFLFVAGNSHAELLGAGTLKGFSVVNGGIGGTSARGYATLLQNMPFTARAKNAIIFVGSNDILTSKSSEPLKESQAVGFDAAVSSIVTWLKQNADTVFVAAVPPVGNIDIPIEHLAVEAYSKRIERLCGEHHCRYFDPFFDMRDERTGFARDGTTASDGVHFVDYEQVRARIVAELDRDL